MKTSFPAKVVSAFLACLRFAGAVFSLVAVLAPGAAQARNPSLLFDRLPDISPGAPAVPSFGLADLNHDGIADLVRLVLNGGRISVQLGIGDGNFGSPATFVVGSFPNVVEVGDVNGDSHPDVLVGDGNDRTLSVLLGNGDGTFQNRIVTAEKFDFSRYETLCDVGGTTGLLCIEAARRHPHLRCVSFDLPPVEPVARKHIAAAGLADRVATASGDFFHDPLPRADVITMGMILHDWNLEKKRHLIRAAYDALPPGGALVAIEALIDDARRENVFGLLMSLNMLIEFGDAFDYSGADFRQWCGEAGFTRFEVIHLAGPSSAAVAYK